MATITSTSKIPLITLQATTIANLNENEFRALFSSG